jgi:hypothetical protein
MSLFVDLLMKYSVFFLLFDVDGCQIMVNDPSGYGSIRSSQKTKYWEDHISCDWVIIGKPMNRLQLSFKDNSVWINSVSRYCDWTLAYLFSLFQLLGQTEQLTCDECGGGCCNNVELMEEGVTTRYCCGSNLPSVLPLKTNSAIVRLNLHKDSLSTRGFHLDWQEG